MKTKITINGFPLLREDECNGLFSAEYCFTGNYFLKPIYRWLPDFRDMDDEEKAEYNLKNVKEGLYLVRLEIISDRWVNKGFCGMLLEKYGLVLDEANPMVKKGDGGDENSLVYLNFDHIALAVYSMKMSVS